MKYIYIIFILVFFIYGMTSCDENENFEIQQAQEIFKILTPTNGAELILDETNLSNNALLLSWDSPNNTTDSNYTIEVSETGTNFENITVLGTTQSLNFSMTVAQLNSFLLDVMELTPATSNALDFRINGDNELSTAITVVLTPYAVAQNVIAVPGNHQGWNPPTAPLLAASSFTETDFQGFVWLDGPYKFIAPDDDGNFAWGNIDWGDDGTYTGLLIETGESNCEASPAGYYLVDADITALTYTSQLTNWGIIGNATPTGWDSDTDLFYDSATNLWTVTLDLIIGEFKFRANDAWVIDLGGDNDGDNFMNFGGSNISIDTDGNYTIALDLSNPRKYNYSIILN